MIFITFCIGDGFRIFLIIYGDNFGCAQFLQNGNDSLGRAALAQNQCFFVGNINNFNVIYLLTQDVYTTTNQAMASSQAKEVDLLVTWLFRLTQDYYNYKMASAIGIIVFIICAVFTLVAFNRMIKGDKEGTYQ
jgi:hypothetical protein